ncbi:MAG: HAMP domain-containing histidine kinase [Candidatus Nomurabacteria bacterium]|jgi:K+-sensing histidine kinase KdpD|nr:HAMP domain-containing histidine kinase [Candidatus Nomurabacteria bacterium]
MNSEGVNLSLVACSHELKTPLCLIRQLTFELDQEKTLEKQQEIIRRIRLTTERSLRLADNLTKIARLEGAMFELEPIQINGLCQEVVDELLPLSRALAQTFDIKISSQSTVVVGHRELLRSLLLGLVDNSLNYTGSKKIRITARQNHGETVLAVRDFGPIMDLSQFRKLSAKLGKTNAPISARPMASSLGLVIADKFASAMQGRLSVSRHHAGGVTFRAHLPLSSQLNLLELA